MLASKHAPSTPATAQRRSTTGQVPLVLLFAFSILLGLGIGVATAVPSFNLFASSEEIAMPVDPLLNDGTAPPLPPANGPQPRVVVDSTKYDFGALESLAEDSHTFVIKNAGDYPLELVLRKTSCKCTVGKLGDKTVDPKGKPVGISVEPGGQTEVTLDWTVKRDFSNHFRQTALLLTNDREMPRLTLEIVGRIAQTVHTVPPVFSFGKLLMTDTATQEVRVESIRSDPLEITSAEPTIAGTAEFFDVEYEPLAPEDLQIDGAKSGYRVRLTVKPGLRQGAIQQTISLATNLENMPTIDVPVQGIIDSDFAIIGGRGWDSALRKVNLGRVQRDTGASRKLTIFVRGPQRNDIELQTPVVTPEQVKVTLGDPVGKGEANSVQYPLTIEIPPGVPEMNHLGNDQGELGKITIETNHPDVPELEIHLQFATE